MAAKRANTSRRSGSAAAKAKSAKRPAAKKTVKASAAPARKTAARKVAAKKAAAPATARKAKTARAAKPAQVVPTDSLSRIVKVVEGALDEMKAVQVKVLDVRQLTDIADTLIIASGTSDRHVRSIADRVLEHAKKAGFRAMGVEGQRDGEWVLVDLQDVIVHIMLPRVREIYRLENLWDVSAARREAAMEKVAV